MTDTLIALGIAFTILYGFAWWLGFVEWVDSGGPLKWNHIVFTIPALPAALLVAIVIVVLSPFILLWNLLDRPVR